MENKIDKKFEKCSEKTRAKVKKDTSRHTNEPQKVPDPPVPNRAHTEI